MKQKKFLKKKEVFIMANVVKVTKRDRFNQLLAIEAVSANEELVAFINREIELLDKKASKSNGNSKLEEVNAPLRDKIVEVLGNADAPMTVSEILAADVTFEGMSNQKISALVRQLVTAGKVVKSTDKKKSLFSLAVGE